MNQSVQLNDQVQQPIKDFFGPAQSIYTRENAFQTVYEVYGLFCDAILVDEIGDLVFGSFFARDTAIREFQSRLTLATAEGGLTEFNITNADGYSNHAKVVISSLKQMNGRINTDVLGEIVHCFLYNEDVLRPDHANHQALLINRTDDRSSLWRSIVATCPIPLLEHWQDILVPDMIDAGMITFFTGFNQFGIKINIREEAMARIVKNRCLDHSLTLHS